MPYALKAYPPRRYRCSRRRASDGRMLFVHLPKHQLKVHELARQRRQMSYCVCGHLGSDASWAFCLPDGLSVVYYWHGSRWHFVNDSCEICVLIVTVIDHFQTMSFASSSDSWILTNLTNSWEIDGDDGLSDSSKTSIFYASHPETSSMTQIVSADESFVADRARAGLFEDLVDCLVNVNAFVISISWLDADEMCPSRYGPWISNEMRQSQTRNGFESDFCPCLCRVHWDRPVERMYHDCIDPLKGVDGPQESVTEDEVSCHPLGRVLRNPDHLVDPASGRHGRRLEVHGRADRAL
ncbi:hypothetical protein CC79DRAFT_1364566 [Sarocladium strictum]